MLAACTSSPSPTSTPGTSAGATPGSTIGLPTTPAPTATVQPTATPEPTPSPTPGPSLAQLIGQKLMVAMDGTTPSAGLLARITAGQVGGVILFGRNITTEAALKKLTAALQGAATAGHQPPLLISTDQEGGSVKRIPWAPPTLSPPQMGSSGSAATAQSQGEATGQALLADGINSDLAPVADVPISTSVFIYQQGRTWSFSAATTEKLANAFAAGLESTGVVPAMKHFPGLGYAVKNTDENVDTLTTSAAKLDPGLDPYRAAIAAGIPMIMLSNAWYLAWDADNAAGWSKTIGTDLLRGQLGFQGVTITDSLNGIAAAMGVSTKSLAIKAAAAGTDMILVTGSEASSTAVYKALIAAANAGTISLDGLGQSYQRILALKAGL